MSAPRNGAGNLQSTEISLCLLLTRPWHRCNQTGVTGSAKNWDRFDVPKQWPHYHFVTWPPEIKLFSVDKMKDFFGLCTENRDNRRKWDANVTKNATRYRIHKHQKRNAATFNYPPAGLNNLYWNDPCLLTTISNWWMNHYSQLSMHGIFSTTSLCQTNCLQIIFFGKPRLFHIHVSYQEGRCEINIISQRPFWRMHGVAAKSICRHCYWVIYFLQATRN